MRLPGFGGLLRKIVGDISHRAGGNAVVKRASEDFSLTGVISPSQITANQDNYNPTGFSTATVVRVNSDASRDITGFAAPSPDVPVLKVFQNVGAQSINFRDENAGSSAANRLALTGDINTTADTVILFIRDPVTQRWRALGSAGGAGGSSFPSGTLMLFQQTAAPTAWTKQTTHNDKALRVVSGTASSGGTSAFSTVFGKTATDATTLTTSQVPAQTHNVKYTSSNGTDDLTGGGINSFGRTGSGDVYGRTEAGSNKTGLVTDTNTGGSHTHPMDIRVQYVDLIIASKD